MSFYSDASLVMIPSGYKTSKVYCAKPTDGSGDLVFSRSNDTATRVGPDGLIEKVRTNLALYSEDLTNAAWTNFSITVGANATTAPNGTTTADKLTPTASNTNHLIHTNQITSAGEYSFSVYVKAAGYSKVAIRESWTSGDYTSFDLTTGTVIDSPNFYTNTITSVGNGWYRITCTKSFSGNIAMGLIPLLDSYTGGSPLTAYAGNGTSGIFAWGAQMEFNVPTEYIGPTLASAVSVGPVANVPRLDYLNSSCGKLLLEPQRTNTITFSENVTSCLTSQVGTTVTANATASPDGYQSADLIAFTPSSYRLRNQTVAAATTYTMSVFYKNNTFSGSETVLFNMSDGVIGGLTITILPAQNTATFAGSGGAWTGVSGKVENYGNGWYRVSATGTSVNGGGGWYEIASSFTKSAYFWGFSLELGAYATSYIPTLGAAVTRGADAASKTGISSLIGQTEGTLFLELDIVAGSPVYHTLMQVYGDINNRVAIGQDIDSTNVFLYINASGSASYQTTTTPAGHYKIALAYKNGDVAMYINGVSAITSTRSVSFGTALTTLFLNNVNGNEIGIFKDSQALLFKTRLSNADLAALTA